MNRFKYASIAKRAIAFTIDDIVVSILFTIIFYEQIVSLTTPQMMLTFIEQYFGVLLLLKVLYHTFLISYSGATLGKYIVKIKAVDEESGNLLSWKMALLRAIVREIGEVFFYFTFIFAFFDKKNQTLHDKVSKCVVIDV